MTKIRIEPITLKTKGGDKVVIKSIDPFDLQDGLHGIAHHYYGSIRVRENQCWNDHGVCRDGDPGARFDIDTKHDVFDEWHDLVALLNYLRR
jgi:hypothetical protein